MAILILFSLQIRKAKKKKKKEKERKSFFVKQKGVVFVFFIWVPGIKKKKKT